jgi:hypothetical protein
VHSLNVTRFRLLFVCHIKSSSEWLWSKEDQWWSYFSSPSYTTLLRCRGFEIVLASASRDTTEKSLFFVFFSVCETQHANERVLLGLGPLAQRWEPFIRGGDNCTSYDEKLCQFTFAVSTLASWSNSPSAECFTFPSWSCWTQKAIRQVWATNKDWCAEQKAGVDAMWEFVTFLWMSELESRCPHLDLNSGCWQACFCFRNEWAAYIWGLVPLGYPRP